MNKVWVTERKDDEKWNPTYGMGKSRSEANRRTSAQNRYGLHRYRTEKYVSEREIFEALGELIDLALNMPNNEEYTKGLMFAVQSIETRLKGAK